MRILMIGWYKPQVGGGSHVIQNLVNQFKNEHKIYVINMEEKGLPTGLGHWKDGNVDVYQEKMFYFKRYTQIQTYLQTTKRALLLSNKVDIYHVHGPFFAGVGFIDKRKPLISTFHGYPSLETLSSDRVKPDSIEFKFMRWVEKKTVERADAVIAVGKTLRKWIIEELGAEPDKVFYVPNGIDPEVFKPINFNEKERREVKRKYKIPEDSIILLFTKHFTPRYGIRYILKSLRFLLKTQKKIYLVATNDDEYLPKIKNLARDLNVYNRCIFTGRLPLQELVKLYNVADIFLHTSINEQETFGISLIEAMACELPVIATAVGGPKEILEEGKKQMGKDVGILIPPKDPEAISQAIIYLLEHPKEAREMGKRAREFVLKNYTWDMVAKKTLDVYRYAIEKHQR